MKRRAVCIFHPDFDPDTPEAVEAASLVANGMRAAGQAIANEAIKDLQRENPDLDITDGQKIALAFEYRIIKVDI
jgi:hypothetical protein